MRESDILYKFVSKPLVKFGIKKTQLSAIIDFSDSLLGRANLTLTGLGRGLHGEAQVKHKIKRVDRWLGNQGLYNDLPKIYQAFFHDLLTTRKHLDILVDWTGCCNWHESCIRASLVHDGRSITIYQEVHEIKEHQKPYVHRQFLENLKKVIPEDSKVRIITDRGFMLSWFKMVEAMGWDFIGRIAACNYYLLEGGDEWKSIRELYSQTKKQPTYLGKGLVGKSKQYRLEASFFGFRETSKKRKRKKTRNKPTYVHLDKMYSSAHNTPWVIVSSISPGKGFTAKQVINKYYSRMQIEQNFRDDKNERWGFGFQFGRSRTIERLSILLLIASISSYILMLIGTLAEADKLQKDFQANTVRIRRVLSLLTLAKQVLLHCPHKITLERLRLAFAHMAKEPALCVV